MRTSRSGYTLLEVILAIAIGLLVLAALYIALDIQLRSMQTGRVIVAEANLARGVLVRLTTDIRTQLALLSSSPTAQIASGAGSSSSSQSSSSGSTSGGGSSSSSTGGSSTDSATGSTASNDPSQMGQINFGLVGDESQMTLFSSFTPRYNLSGDGSQDGLTDQRMIRYGFVSGQGLLRQETRMILGETDQSNTELLAAEVVEMRLRYYDMLNKTWQTSWDGSYMGPPSAIEITVTLLPPEDSSNQAINRQPSVYRMVISVPTACVPLYAITGQGGAP